MEDDEDTSAETSALKTHSIRDSSTLAGPDLLSEVSEMKQDLIKMTAILTTDSADKSASLEGGGLEKGAEDVAGEPYEIMEKVKEDLEKVSEILRSGTYEGELAAAASARKKDEEWVLLSDSEIEEAKAMAASQPKEPIMREGRGNRGAPRPKGMADMSEMVPHLTGDPKEYLLELPEATSKPSEAAKQEKLRKGTKPSAIPTATKKDTKIPVAEIKKPTRRKGPQSQTEEPKTSSPKKDTGKASKGEAQEGESLLSAPAPSKKSPVSPVVEETPIGSIKDKVKALQQKVEAEQKQRKHTPVSKPTAAVGKDSKPSSAPKEMPIKPQAPSKSQPKSPKAESETLEETMSVKELMQAFQTGQDPSKRKSGLFELKSSSSKEETSEIEQSELLEEHVKSPTSHAASGFSQGREVSLDSIPKAMQQKDSDIQISPVRKHSTDFSSEIRAELEDNAQYQQFKTPQREGTSCAEGTSTETVLPPEQSQVTSEFMPDSAIENGAMEDSPDSLKHEGIAESPSVSGGSGDQQMSSEESYKHEGLAESPRTSPDSPSLFPQKGDEVLQTKKKGASAIPVRQKETQRAIKDKSSRSPEDSASSSGTSEFSKSILKVKGVKFGDDKAPVATEIVSASAKPSKPRKLTKMGSETIEGFLSDEESPDGQPESAYLDTLASRASCRQTSLDLPLRHRESDSLSPVADDSLTFSHKDSLEGSPILEDNSSHKTPDSIEPSPTKESPCCDSLESSPVAQKTTFAFPPVVDQPSVPAEQEPPSKAPPDFPLDNLRSRLLRDQEASVEDDSSEKTSQMESSGKSPLSPDTPSSEEVSYEVNPKTPDPMTLSVPLNPPIPEEAEDCEAESGETHRKFTPEEEMFKMAAKIKTFDEMEQDVRGKKDTRKDTKSAQSAAESETGHDSSIEQKIEIVSKDQTPSGDGLEHADPLLGSVSALCVEPDIKVQPPSPFPAGVKAEEVHQTDTYSAAVSAKAVGGGPQSVSEHTSKEQGSIPAKTSAESSTVAQPPKVDGDKAVSPSQSEGAGNRTDEQKEECLRKSRESQDDGRGAVKVTDFLERDSATAPRQAGNNVTDEVKGDHIKHSGASDVGVDRVDALPVGRKGETFKPEVCIYDDTEEYDEEDEPPKTESKGVTASSEVDPWNKDREDDETFAARVKEEEQKILGLAVDRQSQAATPDTTPGRTPTEEGTPTSEPNPFLFQEGKLFEMTRSGAIDMTKRSYEEEGFAFFQLGDQPIEESREEEAREEAAAQSEAAAEAEVGMNLTLQIKSEEEEKPSQDIADSAHPCSVDNDDQAGSKSDASKSYISVKMGLSIAPKSSKTAGTTAEAVEPKFEKVAEETLVAVDLSSPDPVITNVQTAVTTVTRSVYSQQDQESSDSSPEDQHSVIELAKTPEKPTPSPSSEKLSKGPAKSVSGKTGTPAKKDSPSTESPRSRIPVKASPIKSESASSESAVRRAESVKDKKSKLPSKPDNSSSSRRKSETDTGPSTSSRIKKSSTPARSVETDSAKKTPTKKDQGPRPPSGESSTTKSKTFQSRLPVRGKPVQTSTPTKETKKEPPKKSPKQSIDFFAEISDEAAKVVERLVQAEREKERADELESVSAMSDDESSTIDTSVIEVDAFPDIHLPLPEGVFVVRPRWDDTIETQMERIPDDRAQAQAQSQGIPPSQGAHSLCLTPHPR
ncbi:ankyrin-2-like [Engraulis encrasicolus]|uniref:ankyrin-2-like n=1 Tax=Engraulis encrasicolus TaxID=184585 RepID=UPI002FCFC011